MSRATVTLSAGTVGVKDTSEVDDVACWTKPTASAPSAPGCRSCDTASAVGNVCVTVSVGDDVVRIDCFDDDGDVIWFECCGVEMLGCGRLTGTVSPVLISEWRMRAFDGMSLDQGDVEEALFPEEENFNDCFCGIVENMIEIKVFVLIALVLYTHLNCHAQLYCWSCPPGQECMAAFEDSCAFAHIQFEATRGS